MSKMGVTNNDGAVEQTAEEVQNQWILATIILTYSLCFFVVILRHHFSSVFTGCSSKVVQVTQYIRESKNATTSHLVDEEASYGAASPRNSEANVGDTRQAQPSEDAQ